MTGQEEIFLPPRALAIHAARPDIHAAFDTCVDSGRAGLYWWYYLHAFREMGFSPIAGEDDIGPAVRPVDALPQRAFAPVTGLMLALWRSKDMPTSARSLWGRCLDRLVGRGWRLSRRLEQERLLSWFFLHGLTLANLEALLTGEQAKALLEKDACHGGAPRILTLIWRDDATLSRRFASPADPVFRQWCAGQGAERFPILRHPLLGVAPVRSPLRPSPSPTMVGVNIIGHARGRSGVSEDVRMAAAALSAAGIAFAIYNVAPSMTVPDEEESIDHLLTDELPYPINLFCMAGMETVTALMAGRKWMLDGRHNIGFWPWELGRWPEIWRHAYGFMDEIWAGSRFSAQAYGASSPIPVHHMPMAVVVDDTEGLMRADFHLPKDCFLFAFAFDGQSSMARKNPEACVTAFQKAFPMGDEAARLVLKSLRVEGAPAWDNLRDAARKDDRIHLVTRSLSRGALLDLYRASDCFVSLHRSEGFGRNIAETMLLGKPVISTAYSGNMDFTQDDAAALVPAHIRPLKEGEYPFGLGQEWAEPDIETAARLMRRMVAEPVWRDALAERGRDMILSRYSPAAVGAVYRHHIERILSDHNPRDLS